MSIDKKKLLQIRFYFFIGLFGPFITVAFLPWWVSYPLSILFILMFVISVVKAKELFKEEV